ncbi:MAG: apolipoprotein N-acyltransferase [Pseudomonadota bacterium]
MSLHTAAGPGRRWLGLLAVAAAGALQTLACVHTAAWPLPLAAAALLAWAVAGATPRRAALLGWAFGTAWLGAATWWLFISLHRYGGLPAPLAVAAVALLSAALSLYLGAAMAWVARQRSGRPLADASRFAAAWLAAELARGVIFTGFPWAASGYTQVDGPLALLAPWLGVYGIGALLAWVAALLALAARTATGQAGQPAGRPLHLVGLAVLVLALPAAWGIAAGPPDFTRPGRSLQVALLQTNVAQDEKFAAERMPATLAWVAQALTSAQADLVVTPETAVPLLPEQLDELAPGYWAGLQQHFSQAGGRAALVGVPLGSYEAGYTNSVVGLSADTAVPGGGYRYDKTHLVPFGEFIPTGFRWFTALMNIPLGDFNRGPLNPPSFQVRGARVAPNICYEDLFGEELARRFADAATAPTVLANISNIGWFGDSIAIPQHLNISRFRSLELQRPMLRATNTGATAVVDHRGVVTAALPPFSVGVLTATVQGREGLTPFARWSAAAGLWPLWLLAALGLAWPVRGRAPGAGR